MNFPTGVRDISQELGSQSQDPQKALQREVRVKEEVHHLARYGARVPHEEMVEKKRHRDGVEYITGGLDKSQMPQGTDAFAESRMTNPRNKDLLILLRECTNDLNAKTMENANLAERVAKLSSEASEWNEKIESVTNEKCQTEREAAELQAKNAALAKGIDTERQEVSLLKAEMQNLRQEKTCMEKEFFQLEQTKSQFQREVNENVSIRAQLNVMERDIANSKQEKEEMKISLVSVQDELLHARNALQAQSNLAPKYAEELLPLQQSYSALEATVRELQGEVALCQRRIKERNTTIDEHKAEIEKKTKEYADHQALRAIADSKLAEEQSRTLELQSTNAHLRRLIHRDVESGPQTLEVKSENTTDGSHIDGATEDVQKRTAQLRHCKDELSSAKHQIRDAQQQNEQLAAQYADSQQMVLSLRTALSTDVDNGHNVRPAVINMSESDRVVALQGENERLSHRVLALESEVERLEHVKENFEKNTEKHIQEVSEMQAAIDHLEVRQSEAAKQVHRLWKDVRDANGETMDILKWRDEERQAYDALKADYEKMQSASSEDIATMQSELYRFQRINDKSSEHAETFIKEVAKLEHTLRLREDEILKQQLELSTCREELHHERKAHRILYEKHVEVTAECAEARRFLSLTSDDVKSLEMKNRNLRERLSKLDKKTAAYAVLEEKLRTAQTTTQGELDAVKKEREMLSREYAALRETYRSTKETEQKIRAEVETREGLHAELCAEKNSIRAQKDEIEQLVQSLQKAHREDRKALHEHAEAITTLRRELHTSRETIGKLSAEIDKRTAAAENGLRKAHQERDRFIKKYHAACCRLGEIERECHMAQQNYLSEYASFEQLKLNQENALNTLKERILSREAKFYAAIAREKQKATSAEERLAKLSR